MSDNSRGDFLTHTVDNLCRRVGSRVRRRWVGLDAGPKISDDPCPSLGYTGG